MTKENQRKIDTLNSDIEKMTEAIKKCHNNSEKARLDGEIKKCRAEIEAIKKSEMKPIKAVVRRDDPTILDRKKGPSSNIKTGSIRRTSGGMFSVNI